ncbi:MAG: molybdopterin dinucleotide binding domain-containing protein, partial [Lysobacterales bacterium]
GAELDAHFLLPACEEKVPKADEGLSGGAPPLNRPAGTFSPLQQGEGSIPYPLSAITQRPMFMYHSWGSQNAWLRQIATRNALYVHPDTAQRLGLADGDEAILESHWGSMQVPIAYVDNVESHTVWTWNAIGKRAGAWGLDRDAPEVRRGFMLNALIADVLPRTPLANADPVTGQAAWFDLRVRLRSLTQAERAQDDADRRTIRVLKNDKGDVPK